MTKLQLIVFTRSVVWWCGPRFELSNDVICLGLITKSNSVAIITQKTWSCSYFLIWLYISIMWVCQGCVCEREKATERDTVMDDSAAHQQFLFSFFDTWCLRMLKQFHIFSPKEPLVPLYTYSLLDFYKQPVIFTTIHFIAMLVYFYLHACRLIALLNCF